MADYSYDVFISVKRDLTFADWVRGTFLPLFDSYLRQDVIIECRRQLVGDIYYYERNLQPGDLWPHELTIAIRSSRVAVALCSPEYFYSQWCLREFHSFLSRGKALVPVSIYADGNAFPEEVKQRIQAADLSDYVINGEGFRRTDRYVELQEKLRQLWKQVARIIGQAPGFKDWELVDTLPPAEEVTIPLHTIG
jgi:hypothetical protein